MKKTMFSVLFIAGLFYQISASISVSIPIDHAISKDDNGYAVFSPHTVYAEAGYPQLPWISVTLLLPPDADLSQCKFHIEGLQESYLEEEYEIAPGLPPLYDNGPLWPSDRTFRDGKDQNVYSSNQLYPHDCIQEVSFGQLRCYKIAQAKLYLCRYNPVTKKIAKITQGKLVVDFTTRCRITDNGYAIPENFRSSIQEIVTNYDQYGPTYDNLYTFSKKSSYLFLTEASIQSASKKLEDLKKIKESKGFDVSIITESTWGGGVGQKAADNIRKWLQANYKEKSIEYIFLIGSSDSITGKVPMQVTKEDFDDPNDFYYEDISGDWKSKDGFAEVCAGRFPIYSTADITALDKYIDRVIAYEKATPDAIAWRKKALFAEKPFDAKTPGSNVFEDLKSKYLQKSGWTVYRIYSDQNGTPDESSCTENAVKAAWKKDKWGLVEWITHGSPTGASSIMKSATAPELTNETNPPIIAMGSCSNGTIENANNLATAMLKNVAISVVGATRMTRYSIGQKDKYDSTNFIQGIIYEFGRGIGELQLPAGKALNRISHIAKNRVFHNVLCYNLFGCPDVGTASCASSTSIDNTVVANTTADNFIISVTNRFNNSLRLTYSLSNKTHVTVKLFSAQGKLVQTMLNSMQVSGNHEFVFNTSSLSTGVYFMNMLAGTKNCGTHKIVIE